MARYNLEAAVVQRSEKIVRLELDAFDEDEAVDKMIEALQFYPATIVEDGIHRIQVRQAEYEIPEKIDLLYVREDKRFG